MKMPNRFAAWQEANQVRREVVIDEYLQYLDKTRVRVRNATDLADLVARHIAQVQGAPCNKATLMRNVRYKAKILTYQAQHLELGVRTLQNQVLIDPASKAVLTTSRLEVGNLKREIERLNVYIKSLEDQQEKSRMQARLQPPDARITEKLMVDESHVTDYEFKFIRTCQALRTLLNHLDLVLEVEVASVQILDRSKRRNNVIVDKEIAGPFFEWLAKT